VAIQPKGEGKSGINQGVLYWKDEQNGAQKSQCRERRVDKEGGNRMANFKGGDNLDITKWARVSLLFYQVRRRKKKGRGEEKQEGWGEAMSTSQGKALPKNRKKNFVT